MSTPSEIHNYKLNRKCSKRKFKHLIIGLLFLLFGIVLVRESLSKDWQMIFREARQWQIAADQTVIFITDTAQTTWNVPEDWNDSNNSIEVIGGAGGGGGGGTDDSTINGGTGGTGSQWSSGIGAGGVEFSLLPVGQPGRSHRFGYSGDTTRDGPNRPGHGLGTRAAR